MDTTPDIEIDWRRTAWDLLTFDEAIILGYIDSAPNGSHVMGLCTQSWAEGWHYTAPQVRAALDRLKAGGLIFFDGDHWHGTGSGKALMAAVDTTGAFPGESELGPE